MRTLVVIPCKNLQSEVGEVVRGVLGLNLGLDVVVINDGSTDGTSAAAEAAGAHVLEHEINLGKGAALKTGFEYAVEKQYDAVITMDGDGQHDPSAIPDFLNAVEKCDADIILGTRMHAVGEMPKLRIWTNRTTSRIISLIARQEITDSQSGYRLIRVRVLRDIVESFVTTRYDTESELLIRAARRGYTTAAVAIKSIYTGAVSHINPIVDTLRFIRLVGRSMFWR
ncbi:MAG: glycosyltransferase family 2 protein [Candidatus Eisenbacteria bacterium]|nr:glycosyltransferase family 2 protein [Candidatus Eisenbacteria bacterium]